jgi:hypothetical protein
MDDVGVGPPPLGGPDPGDVTMRWRSKRHAAMLGALLVAGALGAGPAAAEPRFDIPTEPERPRPGENAIDLLTPARDLLSGRAWLMIEGLDPGLMRRAGWDPLTRMDWRAMQEIFTAPSAPASAPHLAPGDVRLQAAAATALVPFRDPAPAFSRDLLITRDFSRVPFQTEPHLAVNPADPEHLVLGVIDYNFPTVSSYVSLDGGSTWEGPFQAPYLFEDRTSGGDPVVAFDRDGRAHFASISIGVEEFTFGPVVTFSLVSSIALATSTDGGFTWQESVSTARSGVETRDLQLDPTGRLRGTVATSFLDKPWMTVAPHPTQPDRDVIYVTYTEFEVLYEILWVGDIPAFLPKAIETTIRLVRSEDAGASWSDPVDVSPTVARVFGEVGEPDTIPGFTTSKRVVQGSQPVVAPDGTVYVAWLDSTDDGSMEGIAEIHVAASTDGGRTFAPSVMASRFDEIGFRPRTAFFRFWGAAFPQIAVGPEGELYVVYTGKPPERPADDGDIYFVASFDGGRTWTEARRLNDDDGNALQFFPSIDVDPHGTIHVMWGDMRDDPAHTRYHIYYTASEDRGETWGFELEEDLGRVGDGRVSDFASNPNFGFPFGLFIGDYFSLKATADDVYMVWADTRLGEFGGLNQKIAFSRQRAITSPEVFISPPAGPGGQDITVQGFDFQPDMNVFVQLEDAIIATARTGPDGRFQTRIYVPITGEGAQRLGVFDESGNFASTSFFTEFGFGSIRDLLGFVEVMGDTPRADELIREIRALNERLAAGEGGLSARNAMLVAVLLLLVLGGGAAAVLGRREGPATGDGPDRS